MATRRRKSAEELEAEATASVEDTERKFAEVADKIDALLGDGGSYNYMLARLPDNFAQYGNAGGSHGFLFRGTLQDFNLAEMMEHVQQKYGGGVYKLTIRDERGRVVCSLPFSIAGKPRDPTAIEEKAADVGTGLMRDVMHMQAEAARQSGDKFAQMMTMMMQQQQAASDRQMQMMMQQSQQQTAMLTAMMQNNRQESPAVLMGSLAQTMQALQPPRNGLAETVETMKAIRELTGDGGNDAGSGGDDSGWGMVREAVGALGPVLLEAARNRPPEPARNRPPEPAPAAAMPAARPPNLQRLPQNAAPQAPPVTEEQREMMLIKMMLKNAAKKNRAPDDYVGPLLAAIPEALHPAIVEGLSAENWQESIKQYFPELLAEFPEWTARFKDAILASFDDDGDGSGDDADGDEQEEAP